MKYVRLIRRIWRGVIMSCRVWKMKEMTRQGKEIWHCATCGIRSEPCEHWEKFMKSEPLAGEKP